MTREIQRDFNDEQFSALVHASMIAIGVQGNQFVDQQLATFRKTLEEQGVPDTDATRSAFVKGFIWGLVTASDQFNVVQAVDVTAGLVLWANQPAPGEMPADPFA